MVRSQVLATLAFLAAVQTLIARGVPAPDAKVLEVRVQKEIPSDSWPTPPETSVKVMLQRPGKRILGFEKLNVVSFTDDKKTDLARKQIFNNAINHPALFADGNRIIFPVVSSILPAPGATRLRLKAKVSLRIASNETSLEKNGLLIKEESSVKVGPFELKLGSNIRVRIDGQKAPRTIDVQLNYTDNILARFAHRVLSASAACEIGALRKGVGWPWRIWVEGTFFAGVWPFFVPTFTDLLRGPFLNDSAIVGKVT